MISKPKIEKLRKINFYKDLGSLSHVVFLKCVAIVSLKQGNENYKVD